MMAVHQHLTAWYQVAVAEEVQVTPEAETVVQVEVLLMVILTVMLTDKVQVTEVVTTKVIHTAVAVVLIKEVLTNTVTTKLVTAVEVKEMILQAEIFGMQVVAAQPDTIILQLLVADTVAALKVAVQWPKNTQAAVAEDVMVTLHNFTMAVKAQTV